MLAFIVRRLLISIPILIGSTILVFIMGKLSGDPLENLRLRNPPVPPQVLQAEAERLRLDRSWPEQYWLWLKDLVTTGYFGPANAAGRDIGTELGNSFLVTLRLVLASVFIALILAMVTGVLSAVRQYSAFDYTTTFFSFLFFSMPLFWFAALLKAGGIWFNQNVNSNTFFTIGEKSVNYNSLSTFEKFQDLGGHLILPTIALALGGYAAWTRFTRASVLEVMNSDYVRLARSKGLSSRRVLVKHALRNALIPLTTVTALDVAALLSGAIITETVFQWRGMGTLLGAAIMSRDAYLLMGWLLISATFVIVFNLIADVLYGVLDPRIRHV